MRRIKVSFKATKQVSKSSTVSFRTSSGKTVSFKAHRVVNKPVRVNFYAKPSKKD